MNHVFVFEMNLNELKKFKREIKGCDPKNIGEEIRNDTLMAINYYIKKQPK